MIGFMKQLVSIVIGLTAELCLIQEIRKFKFVLEMKIIYDLLLRKIKTALEKLLSV